jgi:hypothetical protein
MAAANNIMIYCTLSSTIQSFMLKIASPARILFGKRATTRQS